MTLPFDLPSSRPACWYCGTTTGAFEQEHQLPISRGGSGSKLVHACARCNDLKGPLDLKEFRQGLPERLDVAVVFAGEGTEDRPATARLKGVRSLGADRSVVRIDPTAGEELQRAWRYLRAAGDPRLTRRDLASEAIAAHLDALREKLELGDEWPEALRLFDVESSAARTGRNDLAQLPRVPMARQHTKVPGELLDHARAGIAHRRGHGEPDLTLLDWITAAFASALAADADRYPGYPTEAEASTMRYGLGTSQTGDEPSSGQACSRSHSSMAASSPSSVGGYSVEPYHSDQ